MQRAKFFETLFGNTDTQKIEFYLRPCTLWK